MRKWSRGSLSTVVRETIVIGLEGEDGENGIVNSSKDRPPEWAHQVILIIKSMSMDA